MDRQRARATARQQHSLQRRKIAERRREGSGDPIAEQLQLPAVSRATVRATQVNDVGCHGAHPIASIAPMLLGIVPDRLLLDS
jgi:hypothetical protein